MVRTAFYFCVGLVFVPALSAAVLAQDVKSLAIRLGLKTTKSEVCQVRDLPLATSPILQLRRSQCLKLGNRLQSAQFNFSRKREPFSLQSIHHISSWGHQGGSRLFQAGNTIPLLSDALSAGIEMVYRDPFLMSSSTHSRMNHMGAHMFLKGSMKKMKYRAEYGYSGQNLGHASSLAPNDHVGGKFLWEWQLPFVTPKVELSRFASNVDNDPSRNQTISTRQFYSLDWSIPDWPSLTLSYSREQKSILSRSQGGRSDATFMKRVMAKTRFDVPLGKGEWTSRYTTFQNDIHNQGTLQELHSRLKGIFSLVKSVDATPIIGFTQHTNSKQGFSRKRLFANLGTAVRFSPHQSVHPSLGWTRIHNGNQAATSNTVFLKMRYSYRPPQPGYQISIRGQYILARQSYSQENPQTYEMSLFLKKDIRHLLNLPHQQQSISLKIAHNQQVNPLPSEPQQTSSSAMLLLKVIP